MSKSEESRMAFEAALNDMDCSLIGSMYFGARGEMPFSIIITSQIAGEIMFSIVHKFSNCTDREIGKDIKKAYSSTRRKSISIQNTSLKNNTLTMNCMAKRAETITEEMIDLFYTIDNQIFTRSLNAPKTCAVCGNEGVDSYAYIDFAYTSVHAKCVDLDIGAKINTAEANQTSGSYGMGILGAVIGGIVGTIPSVLVSLLFQIISAFLCALIPLGAYYGYKLLKGKMDKVATISTIIVSILMIPIMDYLTEAIWTFKEYDVFITLKLYSEIVMEEFSTFAPVFLQNLLFVGLGVFIVFDRIKRGNKTDVEEASAVMETLRPIEGVASTSEPVQFDD